MLLALLPCAVLAQTPPDAGRILQETRPQPERGPALAVPPIQTPPRPATAPAAAGEVRVQVSQFDFTGNSALTTETLRAAVAQWTGRALNFGELIQVVEAVEARYKEAGYFLAQGYLPPQKIRDGAIEIAITEGRMGEARLEGESRIDPDVVFGYLDRLPKGEALTLPLLERQVLLINELAGSRASLDLQAGETPGSTDVVRRTARRQRRLATQRRRLPRRIQPRRRLRQSPGHRPGRLLAPRRRLSAGAQPRDQSQAPA
ncbi:MAG: ShlB/FhaC/HecB family hemolysin secretion/activation protein [Rhodocyclales bacterium]|nr:ShlB/FhaC/HecB family hemolysin secretion/activation protein [Rhodocyclales bacterium]